jgi:hypothetical protein
MTFFPHNNEQHANYSLSKVWQKFTDLHSNPLQTAWKLIQSQPAFLFSSDNVVLEGGGGDKFVTVQYPT